MNETELTPQQLADRWKITRVWLYNLKRDKRVPKYRQKGTGKRARITFPLEEVIKFEKEHFDLRG
jgi:hypothetical protein